MHPLNNNFFGNTANASIKVLYNSNGTISSGYIVKQPSATMWNITDHSTANTAITDANTHTLQLVGNATPSQGTFTIKAWALVGGAVANVNTPIYVASIDGHHIVASDGNKYIWTIASPLPVSLVNGTPYAVLQQN